MAASKGEYPLHSGIAVLTAWMASETPVIDRVNYLDQATVHNPEGAALGVATVLGLVELGERLVHDLAVARGAEDTGGLGPGLSSEPLAGAARPSRR
ncbi:hypothetical protein [Streptomyces aureus]|uniref:hypothetical protein n=1 Tax=Streptomyces aureus TaxID=193461 RepID=UPI003687C0F3